MRLMKSPCRSDSTHSITKVFKVFKTLRELASSSSPMSAVDKSEMSVDGLHETGTTEGGSKGKTGGGFPSFKLIPCVGSGVESWLNGKATLLFRTVFLEVLRREELSPVFEVSDEIVDWYENTGGSFQALS